MALLSNPWVRSALVALMVVYVTKNTAFGQKLVSGM